MEEEPLPKVLEAKWDPSGFSVALTDSSGCVSIYGISEFIITIMLLYIHNMLFLRNAIKN